MSTASAIAVGPFHGFFSEGATLYRLDPPVVAGGPTKRHGIQTREVSHIIISALDESEWFGPLTSVYACSENGVVDEDYYDQFGTIVELSGVNDASAALARLGYGDR